MVLEQPQAQGTTQTPAGQEAAPNPDLLIARVNRHLVADEAKADQATGQVEGGRLASQLL